MDFEAVEEKPAPPKPSKDEPVPAIEPAAPKVKPVEVRPAAKVRPTPPTTPAKPPAPSISTESFLADLAAELNDLGLAPGAPYPPPAGVPGNGPAASASSSSSGSLSEPLKDVFNEFRAELGEMGTESEDLETHYNLGIAFREMGLLEEAISEFQKVAKENERGRAFPYSMQCCTLLGLSFMDKGQANIAAIWYERALKTPNLDPDAVMALRYDLGVAQATAGDQSAALKSFSQVYAMNIDYRDVADRIALLERSR